MGKCVRYTDRNITRKGVETAKEDNQAIWEFPQPTTRTELRGLLSLAETLMATSPSFKRNTEILRTLMNSKNAFAWKGVHTTEFNKVRKMLTSHAVIQQFSRNKSTTLITGASRLHGIGYALMQHHKKDTSKLVMCGSRALTEEQSNYATAELAALAVLYACKVCSHQLKSIERFEVRSTYKPLQGIFQKKIREMDNIRILRIREKLADFRFNIAWEDTKCSRIAETLCREPRFKAREEELTINVATQCLVATTTLESLIQNKDEEYAILRATIQNTNIPPINRTMAPFKKIWRDLSVAENGLILLKAGKIVIPNSKIEGILKSLYLSNEGRNANHENGTPAILQARNGRRYQEND